jgi:hypothetical protein
MYEISIDKVSVGIGPKNVRINEIGMLHCLAMRRSKFEPKKYEYQRIKSQFGSLVFHIL